MTNSNPPQAPQQSGDEKPSQHVPGYPRGHHVPGTPGRRWENPGADGAGGTRTGRGGGGGDEDYPQPPKVGREDGLAPNLNGAPENVRLGLQAWLAAAALQCLYALVQFIANLVDDRDLRRMVTKVMEDQPPIVGDVKNTVSLETMVVAANTTSMLWMIAAAVICAWLAYRAARGAVYSRMFLNVGSVYLMLTAVLLAFSSGPSTMAVGFVLLLGAIVILSGVSAALGMWFMSRPDNAKWLGIPSQEVVEKYISAVEDFRKKNEKSKAKKKSKDNDKPSDKSGKNTDA